MTSSEASKLKVGDYVQTIRYGSIATGKVIDVDAHTVCFEWNDLTHTCYTKEEMESISLLS